MRFGNYRVIAQLGAGGMGVVYLAEHERMPKRAAVKVINAKHASDASVVERFFNEARAASLIRHEGIIEVFDVGIDDTGAAFLVMEYLEGKSLTKLVEASGKLEASMLVAIMRQVADALAAAHAANIVHRDLKPDNIMVVEDKFVHGGLRAKILDFGIAKLAPTSPDMRGTRAGSIFGTPLYMAPEQTRDAASVDHRADIYAIGCVMYELACGHAPFRGDTFEQVAEAHRSAPVPSLRAEAPMLLVELEALILQCLEKDPAKRPQSMREVAARLVDAPAVTIAPTIAPVASVAPAAAPPIAVPAPTVPPPKPRRAWLVVAGGVLLTAIGIGYWAKHRPHATTPVDAAIAHDATMATVANRWIAIRAFAKPLDLGLPKDAPDTEVGARPGDLAAPVEGYEIQEHEVTWGEALGWVANHMRADERFYAPAWTKTMPNDQLAPYPFTGLSLGLAEAYCASIGGSLPTEAQWEFAARGPLLRVHPWGDDPIDLARTRAFEIELVPVRSMRQDATPDGIYDLAGNAMEWTSSKIVLEGEDPLSDFRVVRGLPIASQRPSKLPMSAAAYRSPMCTAGPCASAKDALTALAFIGFRCVRPLR